MTETRRFLLALAAAIFSLAVLAAVATSADHPNDRRSPTHASSSHLPR
jgi:hypothetical protein